MEYCGIIAGISLARHLPEMSILDIYTRGMVSDKTSIHSDACVFSIEEYIYILYYF